MNQPNKPQFTVVGEDDKSESNAAAQAIMLALSALSQRTLQAFASLFTLLTMVSAFALFWIVLPNPTILQLVGLGIYGGLVLAINVIPTRK
jgi:hypothetical protein